MITREDLVQYNDMVEYINDLKKKTERYKATIISLEDKIRTIEEGETVKDSVRGGDGGIQTFRIEGFPSKEYREKKNKLLLTKINLENANAIIEDEQHKLSEKINEIEMYIATIDDNKIKRIISMRMEGKNWNQIADKVGRNATEDSVRMLFNRFVEKNS